jgi:hypothetical protein
MPLSVSPESTTPLDWAKRRRADRESRRLAAIETRAVHRLGRDWHVIDWPHSPPLTSADSVAYGVDAQIQQPKPAGFLAIGPGGVFSVSIAQHGRNRVLIAGDVVQIGGKRPTYIAQARKDARRAGKAMSAAIGQEIKVFAVVAFVGSGTISVNGLPKDCVVTSYRELDKVLDSTGQRITIGTAEKLSQVARNPWIWLSPPYPVDGGYLWHSDGATPGDKGTTRE